MRTGCNILTVCSAEQKSAGQKSQDYPPKWLIQFHFQCLIFIKRKKKEKYKFSYKNNLLMQFPFPDYSDYNRCFKGMQDRWIFVRVHVAFSFISHLGFVLINFKILIFWFWLSKCSIHALLRFLLQWYCYKRTPPPISSIQVLTHLHCNKLIVNCKPDSCVFSPVILVLHRAIPKLHLKLSFLLFIIISIESKQEN